MLCTPAKSPSTLISFSPCGRTILVLCARLLSTASNERKICAFVVNVFSTALFTSLIALAFARASSSTASACPCAILICALLAPSALISSALARSCADILSFSAFTTLFIASCTSAGGSISFSSVLTMSIPQCFVSSDSCFLKS